MINPKDIKFQHPFCMTFAGPTQSGKTFFIYNLLKNWDLYIDNVPEKILYCYSVWQPLYNKMLTDIQKIEFNNGLPETSNSLTNCLIILDDLMIDCLQNKDVLNLFTIGSHHKQISLIFITQNLYEKGKYSRSISLNSHYFVLFNNRRDKTQINYFARQTYPRNQLFFYEVYEDAMKEKYGNLIIDLKSTNELTQMRSINFKESKIFVYNKK